MKNLDFITNTMIMHRGFFDNERIVENTIKAFKKANSNHHPYELDVRLTKDEKVVVIHDPDLKRLNGSSKKISNMTYDEIKKHKLLNIDTVPLFEDVLKLDNKYGIMIEIKNDDNNMLIVDKVLDLLKDYKGKYSIISFNKNTLKYIRSKNKDIVLGLLLGLKKEKLVETISNSFFVKTFKPDFISVSKRIIDSGYIKKFKKNNPVLIWTIKTREDFTKYKDKGTNLVLENINML
jgi:glycerophosphoryl diester phosphodiesterase